VFHRSIPRLVVIAIATLTCGVLFAQQTSPEQGLAQWVVYVERIVPRDPAKFTPDLPDKLAAATTSLDGWAVLRASNNNVASPEAAVAAGRQILDAKRRVDQVLDTTLGLRSQFVAKVDDQEGRDRIRSYLRCMSRLIDLSGRLRYLLYDSLQAVASQLKTAPERAVLVDLLTAFRSGVGAVVVANYLEQADEKVQEGVAPEVASRQLEAMQFKVLRLIAASGETSCLPDVIRLLERPQLSPQLALAALETIRVIGLPQATQPNTPDDLPKPPVEPARVAALATRVPPSLLNRDQAVRYNGIKSWLDKTVAQGLVEPKYRLGNYDVKPGDWLLMRNPSPYNLFTDLAPGLFTHVGVVTTYKASDGIERMVIVDLPERGSKMPATNVDVFMQRTLHYVFLRHPDEKVAKAMADAARQTIGNDTEFDLNFRTDRVTELKGQDLTGKKIQTYCAGLLLLCALQTDADRSEFFPLDEYPAGGKTVENLAKLGMSFGDEFISPTGALFSGKLQLIGRREPMYDPAREIEEAVFDRFADQLIATELVPTPDLFDSLRLKVAEAAKHSTLLAQALAKSAGVSAEMDLVAAAKAAAVVETLDEVAFDSSADFNDARDAIRSGPIEKLKVDEGLSDEGVAEIQKYRDRHADLYAKFARGQLSPRALRTALVKYYRDAGRAEIDRRFFSKAAQPTTEPAATEATSTSATKTD
jgi:hypothetical protein